ncbi:hypothetical protein [Methanosphaera cuniculi]|uniref:Uncharacterized protein n=1 Tax=Methanosphaera cuniculi TaxID=1077256 RepID=A0A2A2HC84_9EURY|nr:hypothetical protein [Methanosphaera cuniculi]PAV06930.1 hypothetical protein ASJ82_07390 [Methanosphaera cuniculi]PWL08697.1 hypothetical protein MSCUN_04100 [Methanosphaera cuniculi]
MTEKYEIQKIMQDEDNVILSEIIDDEMKKNLLLYEMKRLDEIVPFINEGLKEALDEQEALLIIRKHEEKSVEEMNKESYTSDPAAFTLRTESGKIIGEMIYDDEELEDLRNDPTVYFLSDNFVTYQDASVAGEKQFFYMESAGSDFVTDKDIDSTVKSVTVGIPSTETDHFIRDCFDLSHDESLSSVIIGFTPKDE